jgi:hypothetical protein
MHNSPTTCRRNVLREEQGQAGKYDDEFHFTVP